MPTIANKNNKKHLEIACVRKALVAFVNNMCSDEPVNLNNANTQTGCIKQISVLSLEKVAGLHNGCSYRPNLNNCIAI